MFKCTAVAEGRIDSLIPEAVTCLVAVFYFLIIHWWCIVGPIICYLFSPSKSPVLTVLLSHNDAITVRGHMHTKHVCEIKSNHCLYSCANILAIAILTLSSTLPIHFSSSPPEVPYFFVSSYQLFLTSCHGLQLK